MTDDDFEDELDHQGFMAHMRYLQEQIVLRWAELPEAEPVSAELWDIRIFGDEPVFTSLLFDRMLKERGTP